MIQPMNKPIGSAQFNIKKQASWKGLRLRQGLPVNGQRTHTNARTAKALVPGLSY